MLLLRRTAVALAMSAGLFVAIVPDAAAATAPTIIVSVSEASAGSSAVVGTRCAVTVTASITLPNGTPVPTGRVDFFDGRPGGATLP
jgi:hypothetical protein